MIHVDDRPVDWEHGMTLAALLEKTEHAELVSVVRLNGQLISSPKFAQTLVPDQAVIRLLPLVAGG